MRNVYSAIISKVFYLSGRKDETKDETKSAFRLVMDLPYSPRRYIPHRPAVNDLVLAIPVCMLGALLTLSNFKQEFSCFYFYFCFFFVSVLYSYMGWFPHHMKTSIPFRRVSLTL